jgi:hypothetical protein
MQEVVPVGDLGLVQVRVMVQGRAKVPAMAMVPEKDSVKALGRGTEVAAVVVEVVVLLVGTPP